MLKHKDDEIRRRLTIAEVPEPPADLVHRIKRDIPKHFTSMTAKEVEKPKPDPPLWNFWGMSWQLAASILVLVGFTWAIFEAYRSEVNEASRIAEARNEQKTVEEFEDEVTSSPELFRAKGSAPVDKAGEKNEVAAKEQEAAPTPTATPAPEPPASYAFAPESQAGRRQRRDSLADAPTNADDARAGNVSAKSAAAPQEAPTVVAAAPLIERKPKDEDRVVGASKPTAQAAAPAREAGVPSTPAAATTGAFAEEAVMKKDDEQHRVSVKGLLAERTVKAVVSVDSEGRVVSITLPDESDRAVIDAVNKAAKDWTFVVSSGEVDARDAKRTIDVVLVKQK